MGKNEPTVDGVIKSQLANPKSRMLVLRLEQTILQFIKSPVQSQHLDPMNSFQKLLTHKIAEYYGLGHEGTATSVVVFKATHLLPSRIRLSDLKTDDEGKAKGRPPYLKILKKNSVQGEPQSETRSQQEASPETDDVESLPAAKAHGPKHPFATSKPVRILRSAESNNATSEAKANESETSVDVALDSASDTSGTTTPKTLEAREEAYKAARARLFGANSSVFAATKDSDYLDDSDKVQSELQRDLLLDPSYSRSPVTRNLGHPAPQLAPMSHMASVSDMPATSSIGSNYPVAPMWSPLPGSQVWHNPPVAHPTHSMGGYVSPFDRVRSNGPTSTLPMSPITSISPMSATPTGPSISPIGSYPTQVNSSYYPPPYPSDHYQPPAS